MILIRLVHLQLQQYQLQDLLMRSNLHHSLVRLMEMRKLVKLPQVQLVRLLSGTVQIQFYTTHKKDLVIMEPMEQLVHMLHLVVLMLLRVLPLVQLEHQMQVLTVR